MAEHIQDNFEGTSVWAWEQAHNITRYVRGGCEYVFCTNYPEFMRKCEAERVQRRNEYIAQQQMAAHFGGGT